MENQNKPICKRCLLLQYPDADYFKNLYDYIESIDSDLKVDESEYNRRLDICINCPDYIKGMCRVCGCFVELRAVLKENECASQNHRW